PRVMDAFGKSHVDLAKVQVDKFANDYYQRWMAQNSDKTCSDVTILDVGKAVDHNMTEDDIKDTWGHPIQLMCEEGKFKGVYSWGENGKDDKGLADDIKSWERVKK